MDNTSESELLSLEERIKKALGAVQLARQRSTSPFDAVPERKPPGDSLVRVTAPPVRVALRRGALVNDRYFVSMVSIAAPGRGLCVPWRGVGRVNTDPASQRWLHCSCMSRPITPRVLFVAMPRLNRQSVLFSFIADGVFGVW